jgi:hypothetical protein
MGTKKVDSQLKKILGKRYKDFVKRSKELIKDKKKSPDARKKAILDEFPEIDHHDEAEFWDHITAKSS